MPVFHGPVQRPIGLLRLPIAHDALAHDLAMWLSTPPRGTTRGRLTWENVAFPSGCRPDVFSIVATTNPKNIVPVTYEVKVSRADFTGEMRSAKWRSYMPFSAFIYLAVPEGLVRPEELPIGLGLIVRQPYTWKVLRRPRRHPDWKIGPRTWLNLCLKGRNPSPYEIAARRQRAAAERLRDRSAAPPTSTSRVVPRQRDRFELGPL